MKKVAGIGVEELQRYGAVALFVLFTAPVLLIFTYALRGFPYSGLQHDTVRLIAEPNFPTLYLTYAATTLSTLMGSSLLPSLKVRDGKKAKILPAGIAVLAYSGVIVFSGVVFQILIGDPERMTHLRNEMPADGPAQINNYTSWAIGAGLTVFATLLGVPPPDKPEKKEADK